jgi:hypothetical protein
LFGGCFHISEGVISPFNFFYCHDMFYWLILKV